MKLKQKQMIARPVPAFFGGRQERGDFRLAQEILRPFMSVGGGALVTFYISPVGHG